MPTLDPQLLRTFVAVAERASFSLAADEVRRTQSAVSQQMQRLETQIGLKLFRKSGRTRQLTPHGVRLLEFARRIIALNNELFDSLAAPDLRGPLRIGTPHDGSQFILPHLLTRFTQLYPNVQIEMHPDRSPYLLQALKRGDLEITIAATPGETPDPAHPSVRLRSSPIAWLCAADYAFNRGEPVPLVLPDEPSGYRRAAIEALDAHGIPWRLRHVITSLAFEGLRATVCAGLGITVRAIEMLTPELRALGAAEGLPRMPDMTFFLYLRDEHASLPARKLFESLGGTVPAAVKRRRGARG
jgi:DNA-binding transcriptional LysR family regulator